MYLNYGKEYNMVKFLKKWTETNLILKIIIGLIIGTILGIFVPNWTFLGFLGTLFVSSLKAVAPILVFFLVSSSISKAGKGIGSRFKTVIILYLSGTFLAAIIAVIISILFPVSIQLNTTSTSTATTNLWEVLSNIVITSISNPIELVSNGQYLGILIWAIILGLGLKICGNEKTKNLIADFGNGTTWIVNGIIQCAPIGIMGLVFSSVSKNGLDIFSKYGQLIIIIVSCVAIVAFILNPIISAMAIRRNPYPLVLTCLRESGITAFFSRSSAANIPVNMILCERLGLDKDFFTISIPLGSTINMEGASITIIVMTLALCHSIGISISLFIIILLSLVASVAACGSSGVAGGSILLIPLACSLFGISSDISMQVVGIGFIIGVIEDSCETALNSSSDALFSATAEYYERRKKGEPMNYLGEFAK